MAGTIKLKDWVTLRDQGLLGDLKRKNQKRKETMLQLFGSGTNNTGATTRTPTQTSPTERTQTETEAERQRRLRKKYGISND